VGHPPPPIKKVNGSGRIGKVTKELGALEQLLHFAPWRYATVLASKIRTGTALFSN